MSLAGIWLYCERALWFAVSVGLVWAIVSEIKRRCSGKVFSARALLCGVLFAAYLAALVQIIVIRDWQEFFSFMSRSRASVEIRLIPMETTLMNADEKGIWWELYHILGNMAWFAPLGFLGAEIYPKLRSWRVLPVITLGLSLLLEFSQWFFVTGVSDVDDLILNTLGGCVGFALWKLWKSRRILRLSRERSARS